MVRNWIAQCCLHCFRKEHITKTLLKTCNKEGRIEILVKAMRC